LKIEIGGIDSIVGHMEVPAICTSPFPLTEPTEITGFFNFLGVLRELSERFNGRN